MRETGDAHEGGVQRSEMHRRSIECVAYRRDDGLFDLELVLKDVKAFESRSPERVVAAGEPVHQMRLRVTIDADYLIRDVRAEVLNSPFRLCAVVEARYGLLIGQRIGPGFNRFVREVLGGVQGCTHLTELLPVFATTAFQALLSAPAGDAEAGGVAGYTPRPGVGISPIGGCHALSPGGEVVRRHFPDFQVREP